MNKNEKLVSALAAMLKVEPTVLVESLEKEDGDESLVLEYTKKYQSYTAEDVAKLVKNSNEQYFEKRIQDADFDINSVPKALYDKIKGSAFEAKEKDLAKKHGITEYSNIEDLVNKVAHKQKSEGSSKPDEDLLKQIETLKTTVQEREQEVENLKSDFTKSEINREFTSALKVLPLDYEPEKVSLQHDLISSSFNTKYKVEKKGESIVVLDSNGEVVRDNLAEPLPLSSVLTEHANAYGFKFKKEDVGGRGAAGSSETNTVSLKGRDFNELVKERGIAPNSAESDKLYAEFKAANP